MLPDDEGSAAGSPAGWSVGETLARVAASPPGPQADPLADLPGWPGAERWGGVGGGRGVGTSGPLGDRPPAGVLGRVRRPGRAWPAGPGRGVAEAQLRQENSNLLELALTIDCGVDFTRDQVDQARLLAGTLSATRDRLAAGELSAYRARRIAEELRSLDPVTAQRDRSEGAGHRRHGAGAVADPPAAPAGPGRARPGRGRRRTRPGRPTGGSWSTPRPPRSGCSGCTPTCHRSRPSRSGSCWRPKPKSWPAPTGPPATKSNDSTGNAPQRTASTSNVDADVTDGDADGATGDATATARPGR